MSNNLLSSYRESRERPVLTVALILLVWLATFAAMIWLIMLLLGIVSEFLPIVPALGFWQTWLSVVLISLVRSATREVRLDA